MADKPSAVSFGDGPDTATGDPLTSLKDLQVRAAFFRAAGMFAPIPSPQRRLLRADMKPVTIRMVMRAGTPSMRTRYADFKRAAGVTLEITGGKPPFIRVPYAS
ncbi:MAG: polysaccharide deacetylase family protein [Treponema sp.]|jgi:hypothetical protein|nr:polysaccharide deacetylase family protein [Treponema sp.]